MTSKRVGLLFGGCKFEKNVEVSGFRQAMQYSLILIDADNMKC